MVRDERGNTLVIVILVSMVIGMLASLTLATGRQADWSSTSDRNHEQALGVSEAGIQQQISRVEATLGTAGSWGSYPVFTPGPTVSGPQGTYQTETTHCPPDPSDSKLSTHQSWCTEMSVSDGYVIDAVGTTGLSTFKRKRHVRISLIPPPIFPGPGGYALFSYDTISLKNNDTINNGVTVPGNVFANNSIQLDNNVVINGSITSAQSWVDTGGSTVQGNVWSGGYNPSGHWALSLGTVGGWARASVTAPADPQTCGGQSASNYTVSGGSIAGDATTWGTSITSTAASKHTGVCTAAMPSQPMPTFTYNRNNYNQSTLHEFASVAAFNSWVSQHQSQLSSMTGTFYIAEANPSQSNRVDLSGWNMGGDLTVVSDAPIYTGGISDNNLPSGVRPLLVLVSHYHPATSTDCDYNHDSSDCSVHAKNGLSTTCLTAVLLYADRGPTAVKNNSNFCGSVISDGILIKNNQDLVYDPRAGLRVGFGQQTFIQGRWEELPS